MRLMKTKETVYYVVCLKNVKIVVSLICLTMYRNSFCHFHEVVCQVDHVGV